MKNDRKRIYPIKHKTISNVYKSTTKSFNLSAMDIIAHRTCNKYYIRKKGETIIGREAYSLSNSQPTEQLVSALPLLVPSALHSHQQFSTYPEVTQFNGFSNAFLMRRVVFMTVESSEMARPRTKPRLRNQQA